MSKLIVLDLETTGLDYKQHAIHQLSGMIIIDDVIKERFNFNIKPHQGALIDINALTVCDVTEEELNQYTESHIIYKQFIELLSKYINKFDKTDKFHIVGFNVQSFDITFLREWFSLNGDKYYGSWFYPNTLDVMILAGCVLQNVRHKMFNIQQSTVAAELGIVVNKDMLHDAMYDVKLSYEIYKILITNYIKLT